MQTEVMCLLFACSSLRRTLSFACSSLRRTLEVSTSHQLQVVIVFLALRDPPSKLLGCSEQADGSASRASDGSAVELLMVQQVQLLMVQQAQLLMVQQVQLQNSRALQ